MTSDVEWTPPHDALLMEHLDERVSVALGEENAYWQIAENRERIIESRCERAGYDRQEKA